MPDGLITLGYDVVPDDPPQGERIIGGHIVEKLTLTSSGAFEPLTEGSTKAVQIRTHAGVIQTKHYSFAL